MRDRHTRTGRIGRCEICGEVDHHLVDGACAPCNAACITYGASATSITGIAERLARVAERLREAHAEVERLAGR